MQKYEEDKFLIFFGFDLSKIVESKKRDDKIILYQI